MIKTGEMLLSDVRTQEYNMITLLSQLQTGDFVDIRLRLPSGQDYIVVSKKQNYNSYNRWGWFYKLYMDGFIRKWNINN